MARPHKKGLDYFPLDVDLFEDKKIGKLLINYGPLGVMIYMWLLCRTYKNGYYYEFDALDDLAAEIIRSVGNKWTKDLKIVMQVINYCAEINLVDSGLVRQNVITSASIQRRYLTAVERRQSPYANGKYWLVDEHGEPLQTMPVKKVNVSGNRINVYNNPVNVSHKYTKKSKLKKNKVYERRIRRYPVGKRFQFDSFKERALKILNSYNGTCSCFGNVRKLTNVHMRLLKEGLTDYTMEDYKELWKKSSESEFLTSKDKAWTVTFGWLIKPDNMAKVLNGTYDKWERKDENDGHQGSFDTDEFFELAVRRTYEKFHEKMNETSG